MRTVTGYKLFRLRKDGTIGPLFINARQRIKVGEWMDAEDHPTKGYQHRPGWHATLEPVAPHLCERGRVWCEVRLQGCTKFNRPQSQGGTWVLAKRLKVVRVFKDGLPEDLRARQLEAALACAKDQTSILLGFEPDGKVYASWRTTGTNRHYTPCNSIAQLRQVLEAVHRVWRMKPDHLYLGASSSLDFPHEHTKDPETLAFCRFLRS